MLRHSIFRSHCWVFFSVPLFSPSAVNSVCQFFRITSWTNELQSLSVSVSICAVYVFGFLNRICTVIVFAMAAYAYADVVVALLFIIILSSSFFWLFSIKFAKNAHTHRLTHAVVYRFVVVFIYSFKVFMTKSWKSCKQKRAKHNVEQFNVVRNRTRFYRYYFAFTERIR